MNCYFKGVYSSPSFYLTQVKSWKERPINVWKVKNKTLTEKEHKNLKYVPWYHLWPLSMSPTILEVGQPHRPMVFLVTNRSQQDSCWSIGILNLYSIHITFSNIVFSFILLDIFNHIHVSSKSMYNWWQWMYTFTWTRELSTGYLSSSSTGLSKFPSCTYPPT